MPKLKNVLAHSWFHYCYQWFSAPGTSTSSEIPYEEQEEMGLSDGLIRFSIGLDNDIQRTYKMIKECMIKVGVLEKVV